MKEHYEEGREERVSEKEDLGRRRKAEKGEVE